MKKFSAVLLILALVGGALFASFTGSAEVSFGVDLDGKTFGFENAQGLKAEIGILERIGSAKGDSDIYAEINAELSVDLAWTAGEVADSLDITAKITEAKIKGDNWYVSILGALGAPNFASSAIEVDDDGDSLLDLTFGLDKIAGITVGFADFAFGFGVEGAFDDPAEYKVFLSAVTPAFEFADGLTGKFGLAGVLADDEMGVFGSVEVAFAQDDLAVSLATDLEYVKGEDFAVEVAVAATYDFVSADVYYGLKDYGAIYGGAEHILSVQLGAVIEGFDITVGGKDLVNTQDLYASVGYAINEQLSVGVNGGYVIAAETWNAGAEATYTADMFKATASVDLEGADKLTDVGVKVGVSSDKLVDGATLSLDYASGNFVADPVELGTITAKAKIAF